MGPSKEVGWHLLGWNHWGDGFAVAAVVEMLLCGRHLLRQEVESWGVLADHRGFMCHITVGWASTSYSACVESIVTP